MAYVICEPCIGVKNGACMEVCPVDCIHTTDADEQSFINPDECIECGACSSACPASAIFEQDSVPAEWQAYVEKNASYYQK